MRSVLRPLLLSSALICAGVATAASPDFGVFDVVDRRVPGEHQSALIYSTGWEIVGDPEAECAALRNLLESGLNPQIGFEPPMVPADVLAVALRTPGDRLATVLQKRRKLLDRTIVSTASLGPLETQFRDLTEGAKRAGMPLEGISYSQGRLKIGLAYLLRLKNGIERYGRCVRELAVAFPERRIYLRPMSEMNDAAALWQLRVREAAPGGSRASRRGAAWTSASNRS